MTSPTGDRPHRRSERFLSNIVWSWLGVAATLISGIILSPYLIRKLGQEAYGVWILVFGLIEYYWLFDLGFRSATVKYVAHHWAMREPHKINEIINTGIAYFSAIGLLVLGATVYLSARVNRFFQVSERYHGVFSFLVILIGVSWASGTVFNVFNACLEAFQQFDLSSRVSISSTVVRVFGTFALLATGYGLAAIGVLVVFSQAVGYALSYLSLRKVFPELRFSPKYARLAVFKQMARYGVHTFTATIGNNILNGAAPTLIAHYRPVEFTGYFSLPNRALLYAVDAVDRVGLVSGSNAAELCARRDFGSIARLAAFINRYCLILFMPLTIFLTLYARELVRLWVGAEFAVYSAPLFPILVAGVTIGIASQYNSSSILFGLAMHKGYARALLAEALLTVGLLILVLPRYGIMGAAWITASLMILNRGLFTPWLLCRNLKLGFGAFMRSIYERPALISIPVFALTVLLKQTVLTGNRWFELLAAGLIIAAAYYGLALLFGLERDHRDVMCHWAARRVPFLSRLAPATQPRA